MRIMLRICLRVCVCVCVSLAFSLEATLARTPPFFLCIRRLQPRKSLPIVANSVSHSTPESFRPSAHFGAVTWVKPCFRTAERGEGREVVYQGSGTIPPSHRRHSLTTLLLCQILQLMEIHSHAALYVHEEKLGARRAQAKFPVDHPSRSPSPTPLLGTQEEGKSQEDYSRQGPRTACLLHNQFPT